MRKGRSAGRIVATFALTWITVGAAAEGRKVPLAGIVASEDKNIRGFPALIGTSGEIFEPVANGRWQRTGPGGVSGDVLGAFRQGGRLFAVARVTPLYEQVKGVWYARPLPNRGPVVLARGGAPVVAIGRNVHAFGARGFRRITGLPATPLAIWARDPRQLVAVVEGNAAYRWNGGHWTAIPLRLAAGDGVADLVGLSATDLLLRTSRGSLMVVARSGAKPVVLPADLADFTPDVSIQNKAGIRLIGTRAVENGRQGVLVAFENGGLRLIEPIQELAAGDRFSGLSALPPAGLVATTRQGEVFVRNESSWAPAELLATPTLGP